MLERTLERALALTSSPVLLRWDSGFDSEALFITALSQGDGRVDVLGKWNPRRFDREACAAERRADIDAVWVVPREGKRVTTWETSNRVVTLADGSKVTYNILRLIGQQSLLSRQAPLRHPAKRRRLNTVMQEMMRVAAKLTAHARHVALNFDRHCPAFHVWRELYVVTQAFGRSLRLRPIRNEKRRY